MQYGAFRFAVFVGLFSPQNGGELPNKPRPTLVTVPFKFIEQFIEWNDNHLERNEDLLILTELKIS